ncbi:putative DNA binding protein [Mycobacterium phage SWU1]|uniref:Putative DNA binding protein n=1 Tax=Mycobacterium phage SWU1 TaxID=1175504 RepID=I1V1H7_9CAUD|nr:HTH DNA binding protein [Mycobacterium phage SWU1]AFI24955.1 putative DNA binding protein [Mycobacterium phage SWU1]
MRKKHLKAALGEAQYKVSMLSEENNRLAIELADVKGHRDVLNSENNLISQANIKLSQRLNEALAANRRYAIKQRTQNELFGKALAQVKPETGPSRPNRKKLTEREVKDIRQAYLGGMKQKDLAENYGVNPATISRTVRGIYH